MRRRYYVSSEERTLFANFEVINEKIKELVSAYQMGKVTFRQLQLRLEKLHQKVDDILFSLRDIAPYFADGYTKLKIALEQVLRGNERYIATDEDSYHTVLLRVHHLWLNRLKKKLVRIRNNVFVLGWRGFSELPPMLRRLATAYDPRDMPCVIVKKSGGWSLHRQVGALDIHYSVVEYSRDAVYLDISDILRVRLEAVKDVLDTEGFRTAEITQVTFCERGKEFTNYFLRATGPHDYDPVSLYRLIAACALVGRGYPPCLDEHLEEDERTTLHRRGIATILRAYVRDHALPFLRWKDVIFGLKCPPRGSVDVYWNVLSALIANAKALRSEKKLVSLGNRLLRPE